MTVETKKPAIEIISGENFKIERKISVGSINGVRKGFKNVTEKKLVARIIGLANSFAMEMSDGGDYAVFKGEVRASNEAGEKFVSPKWTLPGAASDILQAAMESAPGKSVEFGFDVFVDKATGKSALGFVYLVKPLFEAAAHDQWATVLAKVAGSASKVEAETIAPETPAKPAPQLVKAKK